LPQNPVEGKRNEELQGEQQDNVDISSCEGSQVEEEAINSMGSIDLPIALRHAVKRYGFNVHDISKYVWYDALSHSYLAFVASLQLLSVPTN
jgi:hypothetical protein